MTIPAKLQSYMACGMPILAVADGETRRIIEEAECGKCIKIGDIEKLTATIIEITQAEKVDCDRMSLCAQEYAGQFVNRSDSRIHMILYFGE